MKFKVLKESEQKYDNFEIDIPYKNLPIEVVVGTYPATWDGFSGIGSPAEDITRDLVIDYTYTINWSDYLETIRDIILEDEEYLNKIFMDIWGKGTNEVSDREYGEKLDSKEMEEYLYEHAKELVDRYIEEFRGHFEPVASFIAGKEFEFEEPDEDMWRDR